MRSDMGLSELMASVVSGIAIAPALLALAGAVAALTTVAGACGGAAFAACCITARESTITETTGKNKIIHRIFMGTNLYSYCGMKSYRRQSNAVILQKPTNSGTGRSRAKFPQIVLQTLLG